LKKESEAEKREAETANQQKVAATNVSHATFKQDKQVLLATALADAKGKNVQSIVR